MAPILHAVLKRFITRGRLDVIYPDGKRRTYGTDQTPYACMHIKTPEAEKALIVNPGLGFGEAYMDEKIIPVECDLYQLMEVLMRNDLGGGHLGEKIASFARYLKRSWVQFNPERKARKNIAHHYDLNSAFYRLFLDKDMQYSCAYYKTGHETLEQAQIDKKRHIAAKLKLDRSDLEVLDIGCGWGGMAITLAKEYGAKVTGVTLSKEQLHVAQKRAAEEGLVDKVRFELIDYRNIRKKFDRIVSVGMFEHVGIGHYSEFFKAVKRCLKDDGIMVLHSIGRSDGPGSTNAWIDRYIFPGGYSPALSETLAPLERSGLWVADCEILRLHYAYTLAEWRKRLEANKEEVLKMYDARFYRMFSLYLIGAELTFRYQGHMNFQLQIVPQVDTLPITRDYMFEAEKKHQLQRNNLS